MAKAMRRAKAKARTARRRKATSRPRAKARAKAKRPPHKFVVSHLDREAFAGGLRAYAKYRDLGMSGGTGGMVQAHIIRMLPPFNAAEVSKRHYHDVDFQMIYVLKGWITTEIEGHGIHTMREGTCWTQPPRIPHVVLDYSDDCELLEIVLPAEFDTVEL